LKDYLWGGRRLETLYGRNLPPGIVAESWEISGHPNGLTAADAGPWAGRTLTEIQETLGSRLVGTNGAWALQRGRFPLLVKLLDAHQDLSLQVHPGDAYALAHENDLGKTEMWYVLHADPGTELILGLEQGVSREALVEALATARPQNALRYVPIRSGQALMIPAGTVHALLAGAVVAEIQQNSDATYRIYDWGRVGPDGNPRPLHLDKALDVIAFESSEAGIVAPTPIYDRGGVRASELVRNDYFVVEELLLTAGASYMGRCEGESLEIWGCIEGRVSVQWQGLPTDLPAIRFTLLPAVLGEYRLVAATSSRCLRVYLPSR
jgi:mannose-6-phosphate isomerase